MEKGENGHYNVVIMPRPVNRVATERIVVSGSPKMLMYLDDLVGEEGYGMSRAEVAKNLVWRAIENLIAKGILDRRKGPTQ